MFNNHQIVQSIPYSSKQGVSGVCKKGDIHGNKKIQYICLEDNCWQNRQLCKSCVTEQHRLHKVYRIDRLLRPLNRLNMNSYCANSQERYAFFQEKIKEIQQECQSIYNIINKHMSQMKNGIILQMKAFMETFKDEEINRVENLLLDTNSKIEDINQCVKYMNFLQQQGMEDVQILCDSANNITNNITNSIKKLGQKMNTIMEKFQKQVKKMSFINTKCLILKKTNNQNEEDQNTDQESQQKRQEEQILQKYVCYPLKRTKKMTVVQIDNQ